MSRVLALDTATHTCTLALYDKGTLYGRHEIVARAHNRHILGMLSAILDGRALADAVDVIACGVGPGSFTGLRVAVSVAQGLAWSQALPVHGFCSLTAQAHAAGHHGLCETVTASSQPSMPRSISYMGSGVSGEVVLSSPTERHLSARPKTCLPNHQGLRLWSSDPVRGIRSAYPKASRLLPSGCRR